MIKYSKDLKIKFDPESHTYFNGDQELLSVTRYISKFKKEFQKEEIAQKYAIKNGFKVEDVLLSWDKESNRSKIHGTACHNMMENYINTKEIKQEGISTKEKSVAKFINDFFEKKRLIPIEAECIVYNDFLASQIDCIAYNPKNNEYYILDWKTNKKIELSSPFMSYMKYPYNDLPDLNYYHYSLQLSIYKQLYKDFPISACYIIHLKEDEYQIYESAEINTPLINHLKNS